MTGAEQANAWFAQLMRINSEAFDAGHYEVAYHALMASLHAAQDAGDVEHLQAVERTAEQQQDRIDADAPKHGAMGIFQLAARQASARAAMVQHDRHAHGE
jgi:hypothetical protein